MADQTPKLCTPYREGWCPHGWDCGDIETVTAVLRAEVERLRERLSRMQSDCNCLPMAYYDANSKVLEGK